MTSEPTKNILLIVSDDLRASVLGCYGDKVCRTPNIDRLAAKGMVFDRAYCQATHCAPSRASFMRGRYHGKQEVTFGEHFIQSGGHSARVGKIFHMRVPGDIIAGSNGDDVEACWSERFNAAGQEAHTPGNYACLNLNLFTTELEGRQSTGMPHRPFVSVRYDGDGTDQPDWKAASKASELLEAFAKSGKPFFLAMGFVRPHYPSVAPEKYFAMYPHKTIELPPVPDGDLDDIPEAGISKSNSKSTGLAEYPENQKRMWAAYYATVTFMDEQVGRLLEGLEANGLDKNTIVVFTSDHGYHLGDHTFWQKQNVHEQVIRVPLIITGPGIQSGRTHSLVELVDLFPTLCDVTGLKKPESVQGLSLVPVLEDPNVKVRDLVYAECQNGYVLRSDQWAYMRYRDGSEELYDMSNDPSQFNNLVDDPNQRQRLEELRRHGPRK